MNAAVEFAALLVTMIGIASFAVALTAGRAIRSALPVLLDFLTAAGLIRLAVAPSSWTNLLLVTVVISIRKIVAIGFVRDDLR
ncbi:hypothetical protein RKD23_000167 [Streptomyces sp. SAI-170]|uniref:hypothetical protein n=1 Tax=Streptomyces sp. SAI-170 TaxID=3377729 RepID=UPI003C7AD93B